jgi:ubiquinone/menaquinone biosynthesis C-methylase UbiE
MISENIEETRTNPISESHQTNKSQLKEELRAFFNAQAHKWDNKKRWNSYYKEKLAEFCHTLIPFEGSVLEVGCATGELLSYLKPKNGVGIDFSSEMIAQAKKKFPQFRFLVADVEEMTLADKFDIVVLSDLTDCLVDVWQTFRQLQRTCSSDTRIIITYHNHLWEPIVRIANWLHLTNKQPVQNWLSPSQISDLLHLNGYDVIRHGNFILFPIYIRYIAPLPFIRNLSFSRYTIARLPSPQLNEPSVTVLVPCLNEVGNIEPLLDRLPTFGRHMEILFVDGKSTDGTQEAIKKCIETNRSSHRTIKLLTQEGPKGKGTAVRQGFAAATGDILMILDADISVAPEDLMKFYLALVEGKGEMINGSRLVFSMEKNAMQPINFLGNHFFRIMFSWILGQSIQDTLCGTKVLYKKDYERLAQARSYFGDFDPFGDFDLLFGASRLNLKIINIPLRYEARRYGTTKIHRWSHGWLLLKMVRYAMFKLKFS